MASFDMRLDSCFLKWIFANGGAVWIAVNWKDSSYFCGLEHIFLVWYDECCVFYWNCYVILSYLDVVSGFVVDFVVATLNGDLLSPLAD